MAATFYLSATWHPGDRAGRRFLQALLARLGRRPRICYIGAPHGDHPAWTRKTCEFLAKGGARVDAPELAGTDVDVAAARSALRNADLLYLDGGDTVEFVRHVERHRLRAAFAAAAQRCRFVFGLSGGACAAAPFTIGYGDGDEPYVATCLRIGSPWPLDVHDEGEDWPELRALLRLAAKDPKVRRRAGIAIPTGSALVVAGDGKLGSLGRVPCELRALGPRGRWQVSPIPVAGDEAAL
jgi:hypothetical protein